MAGLRNHLPSAAFVVVLLLVIAALAGAFVYTGLYNIGADAPHSRLVYRLLQEFRDKSIERGARSISRTVTSTIRSALRPERGSIRRCAPGAIWDPALSPAR